MADFKHERYTFDCKGLNLSVPVDMLPPNKYRILDNVRPYGSGGQIQGRQGTVEVSDAVNVATVHSIKTFDDPVPSPVQFPGTAFPYNRLRGVGEKLEMARSVTDPTVFIPIEADFSGDPLSFVMANSETNPRPWCYIADSVKMRKISSFALIHSMGIAPPNFAPTITLGAANANGPDIGTTGNPYVYLFVARCSSDLNTGAISAPGPAVRTVDGLSPSSAPGASDPPSNIIVTAPQAHPNTDQVAWLDVYRYGGSITSFKYIGTITSAAGATLEDTFADADILSNPDLEWDNNQPFMTVDSPRTGSCTITALGTGKGGTVTWTSGDTFSAYDGTGDTPFWPAGTQISINGVGYTFYRSPDDNHTVEILEDPGSNAGGVFLIPSPELMHQPLPVMWGPYGGGSTGTFVFAVGDPLRKGAVYWTKGNHPESHPATNVLEITSASEPMMNGCMFDGKSFVFSTERAWVMYPNFGGVSDWLAIEIPNSKGLFAKWALCVTPDGIVFRARDGIYITNGGPPVSLTDLDLYPIFPHEGDQGSAYQAPDGITDAPFSPPDDTHPEAQRLAYGDGFVKFTYLDQGGTYRTLVYSFPDKGWVSRDSFTPAVAYDHYDEGEDRHQFLMGTTTGTILAFGGTSDSGNPIVGRIRTPSRDASDSRPRKLWGDVEVDLDSQCEELTIKAGFNNFTFFSALDTTGFNFHGRSRSIGDINSGLGQYAYNFGLDITWTVSVDQPIFYAWTPSWLDKPVLTALRTTDWEDCGYPGAKFFQGFKLRADTLNATRSVGVLSDGGVVQQTFSVLHPIEDTIAYVFTTPFISHLIRLLPTDANFWRIEGVEWIWEPAPELVTDWITQETTHDYTGWFHHRDSYIALISSAVVTMTVTADGTAYPYSIASTASAFSKPYVVLQPMKAKAVSYGLRSSAGFRLFQRDTTVRVKEWGTQGPYLIRRPFGDVSRINGARI